MEANETGLRGQIDRRVISLCTSRGEHSIVNQAAEAVILQMLIPANTWRQGEHINIRGGGFTISDGGIINTLQFFGRIGTAGLASPAFLTTATYNPGSAVQTWWMDFTVTHDVGNPGNPDFCGLGGVFHLDDGVARPFVGRGEITCNFAVDNTLIISGRINGTGTNRFIVNETFQVVKVPSFNGFN